MTLVLLIVSKALKVLRSLALVAQPPEELPLPTPSQWARTPISVQADHL